MPLKGTVRAICDLKDQCGHIAFYYAMQGVYAVGMPPGVHICNLKGQSEHSVT